VVGVVHGPESFRVDAAFVAAHFPPRVVWGSEFNERSYFAKTAETTPTFQKVNYCACAHNKITKQVSGCD